jgi:hypothetical protein
MICRETKYMQCTYYFAVFVAQVSEKIQAVQEGERTPASPPPWGYHAHSQDSIENPDSAKESPSTSQPPSQPSSQPLSPQDSQASILSPPPPVTESSTESTESQPKAPSQAPQGSHAAAEAGKAKPTAKPGRKNKKKEKVVDLDNSQEPLVVHKKVKKKKKAAGWLHWNVLFFVLQYSYYYDTCGITKIFQYMIVTVEVLKQCPEAGIFARHRNNQIYRSNRHRSNEKRTVQCYDISNSSWTLDLTQLTFPFKVFLITDRCYWILISLINT